MTAKPIAARRMSRRMSREARRAATRGGLRGGRRRLHSGQRSERRAGQYARQSLYRLRREDHQIDRDLGWGMSLAFRTAAQ